MKLSKFFTQAALGLVITTSVSSMACAAQKPVEPAAAPKAKCHIVTTDPAPLRYHAGASLPTLHVYDYELKKIIHVSPKKGTVTIALASASADDRSLYEHMKGQLSPACKTKLGVK